MASAAVAFREAVLASAKTAAACSARRRRVEKLMFNSGFKNSHRRADVTAV
jgi:hypothetical protein